MAHKKIILKGGNGLYKEAVAAAGITPGHLIQWDSAGKFKVHANAGQPAAKMFALRDSLVGEEIGHAYVATDRVFGYCAQPGDEIYAWLADGENVAIGDYLESNGDGTLKKWAADTASSAEQVTIYPNQIVAVALEAVDLSASANTADGRIIVQVF